VLPGLGTDITRRRAAAQIFRTVRIERIFGRTAATAFDIGFRGDMLWRVFAIEINISNVPASAASFVLPPAMTAAKWSSSSDLLPRHLALRRPRN